MVLSLTRLFSGQSVLKETNHINTPGVLVTTANTWKVLNKASPQNIH